MELSTVVSPETGDIEIRSRERLTEDDWAVHAVARSRKPVPFAAAPFALPADRGPKTASVTPEKAYHTARQFGLDYGPRFQLLAKATAYGERFVEVELKDAAAPGHPMAVYDLNPMSVDATFHGLVALFDRFSGERGGAPYIPVRFGSIRFIAPGVPVKKALVEIERVSGNSIKAKFHFYSKSGELIAAFEDCRFRRTYLRQHKGLRELAFHYETVPSLAVFAAPDRRPTLTDNLLATPAETGIDETSLLINAAIYRACHEIALKLARGGRTIETRKIGGDFEFRCFLENCLLILEDAGLCQNQNGTVTIEPEFSLPAVGEILTELYADRSDRAVEAVLVNNAYVEALARIEQAGQRQEAEAPARKPFISEATADHQSVHSAAARQRAETVLAAIERALKAAPGAALRLLELGTVSPSFSRKVADLAGRHGATLAIFEPRENPQRNLELTFETSAHVTVLAKDSLAALPVFDLAFSASDSLQMLIEDNAALRAAFRGEAAHERKLIAAVGGPGIFADFVFGMSEGWFARSQASEFPIGKVASASQWQKLFEDLGVAEARVDEIEVATGALIGIETAIGSLAGKAAEDVDVEDAETILLVPAGARPAKPDGHVVTASLKGDLAADKAEIGKAIRALRGRVVRALYLSPAVKAEDAKAASILEDRVLHLSAFAEAVRDHFGASEPAAAQRPRLVVFAPGGAPVTGTRTTSPVNAGLWVFGRVVQNEYDLIDLHLVDADGAEASAVKAALRLASADAGNREWVVDPASGRLGEVRAVPGPVGATSGMTHAFEAATIRQRVSSQVGSIAWEETDIPKAGAGEIVVKVAAAGLNFRDVMWAMGLLPEEALEDGFAGATIGMELSGHVVAVGEGVSDLAVGDAVMAIASDAFSTHAVVSRAGVARLPSGLDPVAAASVPVAFLTAYYAMVELGRMQAGETILIHGAAGGVGLAAIQIAKLKGAKIIATAGTQEKRRFLTMLGVDHVFDSRTLAFVEDVRRVTNGAGVDLVLNSLFADAMELSLQLVKPFGRFLELGKRDYYGDSKIGLRPFRRNISYFGIDADQLLVNQPALTRRIFTEIGALFEEGRLSPLPFRAFDHDEIGNAFRLMQNAGHIGKIVVLPPVAGRDEVASMSVRRMKLSGEGVHLVIGGIGGFGLVAANWLVEKGARRIALCSRRGVADAETKAAIARWQKLGVTASVHACDVTNREAATELLATLRAEAPIKGIVHAAMVLDDALISNLSRERNHPVIAVKAEGAGIVDALTRGDDLDLFLMFSSATTLVGNPGQSNYVAANGYLEGLARARRAAGLAGLAVGFGAIADTGYLAQNTDVNDLLSKRIGKTALKAQVALDQVEAYIEADPGTVDAATVMISEIDWQAARNLPVARQALFEIVLRSADQHAGGGDGATMDLVAMIEGKSAQDAEQVLFDVVASEIAAILRVSKDTISRNKVLKEIGLDSLMAVELGMSFQQNTGFDMPLSGVADTTTVGDVARKLYEKVSKRDQGGDEEADAGDHKLVAELAQRHVATAGEPEKALKQ